MYGKLIFEPSVRVVGACGTIALCPCHTKSQYREMCYWNCDINSGFPVVDLGDSRSVMMFNGVIYQFSESHVESSWTRHEFMRWIRKSIFSKVGTNDITIKSSCLRAQLQTSVRKLHAFVPMDKKALQYAIREGICT